MDSKIADVLESFTPYEIAAEEGLGYQLPHHSHDSFLNSGDGHTRGAAVVCEEAWKKFLQTRENEQRAILEARDAEAREHARASCDRFCTHKNLTPGFVRPQPLAEDRPATAHR